jgi:PHD/YefM family antitoxin component YafN of YafNO toxin-antitoxin module
MSKYEREEIMSSSEVVRNFGTVLTSVVQHKREKVAIVRNNKLEAVLLAVDVYERLEKTCEAVSNVGLGKGILVEKGNSGALLEFLHNNRLLTTDRLSIEEIDHQILEEREAWE